MTRSCIRLFAVFICLVSLVVCSPARINADGFEDWINGDATIENWLATFHDDLVTEVGDEEYADLIWQQLGAMDPGALSPDDVFTALGEAAFDVFLEVPFDDIPGFVDWAGDNPDETTILALTGGVAAGILFNMGVINEVDFPEIDLPTIGSSPGFLWGSGVGGAWNGMGTPYDGSDDRYQMCVTVTGQKTLANSAIMMVVFTLNLGFDVNGNFIGLGPNVNTVECNVTLTY